MCGINSVFQTAAAFCRGQGRLAGTGGFQRFFQTVGQMGPRRFRRGGQGIQPGDQPGGAMAEVTAGRLAEPLGIGIDPQKQRGLLAFGDGTTEPVAALFRQLVSRADLPFFTQLSGVSGRGQQDAVAVAAGHAPLKQLQRFPSAAR